MDSKNMPTPLPQSCRFWQSSLRHQHGSSLLEVLVAVLIVSLGLLGLVGLQAKATSMSVSAEDRSRAALLANDFVSTMQLMRQIPEGTVLDALQERAADTLTGGLPDGEFKIDEVADNIVAVTVEWTPTNTPDQPARHTTVAIIP